VECRLQVYKILYTNLAGVVYTDLTMNKPGCKRCQLDELASMLSELGVKHDNPRAPHTCSRDGIGVGEAASLVGVTRGAIYKWISAGELKPIGSRPLGRLFRRADVLRVAKRHGRVRGK
jgi:excisionase family DNA binding protein